MNDSQTQAGPLQITPLAFTLHESLENPGLQFGFNTRTFVTNPQPEKTGWLQRTTKSNFLFRKSMLASVKKQIHQALGKALRISHDQGIANTM
jgi:hypothetical protein